jgi:hypothetical protein
MRAQSVTQEKLNKKSATVFLGPSANNNMRHVVQQAERGKTQTINSCEHVCAQGGPLAREQSARTFASKKQTNNHTNNKTPHPTQLKPATRRQQRQSCTNKRTGQQHQHQHQQQQHHTRTL